MAPEPTETSLREAIRSLGDNLAKLLAEHVALAQVELKREGERLTGIAVLVGVGLLWASVGYIALVGALVALLAQAVGVALAATIIGLLNLVMGAGVVAVAVRRIKANTTSPLAEELEEDVAVGVKELDGAMEDQPEGATTPSTAHRRASPAAAGRFE